MLTIHAHADRKALIDNASNGEVAEVIDRHYGRYIEYLESRGVKIDWDSNQTTYCWSGADDWPDNVQTFWDWLN